MCVQLRGPQSCGLQSCGVIRTTELLKVLLLCIRLNSVVQSGGASAPSLLRAHDQKLPEQKRAFPDTI